MVPSSPKGKESQMLNMTALLKFLSTLLLAFSLAGLASSLEVGDGICTQGFVMDKFCIKRGTFLDEPDVTALENPDMHTYHCMFDPDVCRDGYVILAPPGEGETNYTEAYGFDEASNTKIITDGRALGAKEGDDVDCPSCTGTDSSVTRGMYVGIKATVTDASTDPPVVSINEMEAVDPSGDYCATSTPTGSPTPSSGGSSLAVLGLTAVGGALALILA
jgi:hypothetical protein